MTDELLRQVLDELRGLRADLRRSRAADAERDLQQALAEHFAGTPAITAAVLLDLVDDAPHSPVSDCLAALIDLEAEGRGISLGRLLARLPNLELVGTRRGGALYRCRREE